MPLRIAIGSYRPWTLPATYTDAGSAISDAKSIFEMFDKKPEVSVWDTPASDPFTFAQGTCICKINRKSYDGVNNLSDPSEYPAEREPRNLYDAAADPGYTLKELADAAALVDTPSNTDYYGPFQVDGEYVTESCGDTIKVLYDVPGGGLDETEPLAVGPLGLSEIPPFSWKYKAVPFGLDPSAVPWSDPTGPEYEFVGLIPGLDYTFYYTDEAGEIEES